MDAQDEPSWQPLKAAGVLTAIVRRQLEDSRRQLELLRRVGPGELHDHTVDEFLQAYGEMAEDYLDLYAEQGRRWRRQAADHHMAVRTGVEAYATVVEEHLAVITDILALVQHLSASTIEKVLTISATDLAFQQITETGPYKSFNGRRRSTG